MDKKGKEKSDDESRVGEIGKDELTRKPRQHMMCGKKWLKFVNDGTKWCIRVSQTGQTTLQITMLLDHNIQG